jgi:flagellin
MTISSGGDGNWNDSVHNNNEVDAGFGVDYVHIDEVTEDLLLFSVGSATFAMNVSWDSMSEVDYSTIDGMQVVNIETQEGAQKALDQIDDAIVIKDNIRANLGALQNRLENTVSNLEIQAENLQAAESRISDVDVATEMTEFVREQILTQAATAMLAQANSLPKMALQLIGGG